MAAATPPGPPPGADLGGRLAGLRRAAGRHARTAAQPRGARTSDKGDSVNRRITCGQPWGRACGAPLARRARSAARPVCPPPPPLGIQGQRAGAIPCAHARLHARRPVGGRAPWRRPHPGPAPGGAGARPRAVYPRGSGRVSAPLAARGRGGRVARKGDLVGPSSRAGPPGRGARPDGRGAGGPFGVAWGPTRPGRPGQGPPWRARPGPGPGGRPAPGQRSGPTPRPGGRPGAHLHGPPPRGARPAAPPPQRGGRLAGRAPSHLAPPWPLPPSVRPAAGGRWPRRPGPQRTRGPGGLPPATSPAAGGSQAGRQVVRGAGPWSSSTWGSTRRPRRRGRPGRPPAPGAPGGPAGGPRPGAARETGGTGRRRPAWP